MNANQRELKTKLNGKIEVPTCLAKRVVFLSAYKCAMPVFISVYSRSLAVQ